MVERDSCQNKVKTFVMQNDNDLDYFESKIKEQLFLEKQAYLIYFSILLLLSFMMSKYIALGRTLIFNANLLYLLN